ncbi:unnamed protein product [Effrenium voratum]|uniref:C3H1-type domain-containing protein n=1 Tax=Effrenium voratum TaxID=2562239 RepID=A0AA36JT02_9DINO|nr:unnamed protein product [Effrenium voratum]CAJ1411222.1 unnamed protein product [Effrenium voratum]CAJ1446452.1 unnamed protein product [Effrenium voratum]
MAGSVLLAEMYGQLDWLQEPMKVVISEARRGSDLPEVAEELEGKALQRRKLRLKGGMSPISMGSLGHPELCRRPCVYVASYKTACPHGSACSYCHLPHAENRAIDKRQRDFLKSLSDSELLAILLPHMYAKVLKGRMPPETMELLQLLQLRCGWGAFGPPTVGCPNGLEAVLQRMTFSWLLSLLSCSKDPELTLLVDQLRVLGDVRP